MRRDVLQIIDAQIARSRILREAAGRQEEVTVTAPGQVITISRQLGSGGKIVAERLVERLGWSLWDKNLVDAIAENADVARRVVESFDEKTMSEIEVFTRSLTGEPEVGGFYYKPQLARAVLSIARHGSAVILGRAANFLLPDALNVRLVACEETRIKNLMRFEGVSRGDALDCIRRSDKERATFVKNVFGKDVNDPLDYDMVIATDSFGVDGTADVIVSALDARVKYVEQQASVT